MPHNTTRNQRRTVDPRRMKAVAVACIIIVLGVVTTHRHTGNPAPLFLDEVYTRGLPEDTPALVSSSVKANSSSSPSYQLAFEQSGGFFDDISDSSWKRLQQIARRTWPNHFSKDLQQYANHPTKDKSNWWNAENFQEEFHCQFAERLPSDSNGDGPKWVCDPHRIAQQQAPCLVYSVGSNGNVMFEKAVKQQISPDCEIHTFDLTTYNKRNGDFAQALKGYATFHNWGLGTAEQAATKKNFKTLEQTVKALGHEGRRIDVFKIDCELCEWHVYQEWLQADMVELKQILVETHNAPMPYARDFFFHLHDYGYVIFSKEANYQNGAGGVEFAFLKLSPEFFINGSLYSKADYAPIFPKKVNY